VGDDLLAVEAAVFYENFSGEQAAYHYSGYVKAWDVALQGFRIGCGAASDRVEMDAQLLQEREIRVVAGHRENL
jgi:hypothetical protein